LGKNSAIAIATVFVIALGAAAAWRYLPNQIERAIREKINAQWPPKTPASNALAAIEMATLELQRMTHPDVYAGISQADLTRTLPEALKTRLKEFGSVTIHTANQELVVDADFDLAVDQYQMRVSGHAEVHAAVFVRHKSLLLLPSFSRIAVGRVHYGGQSTAEQVLPIVNHVLATFLDNVNGTLRAFQIGLDWSLFQTFDPAKVIAKTPEISEVAGPPIAILIGLGYSATLIDSGGVHVLAELVPLTSARISSVGESLEKRFATNADGPLTSDEVAVISACAHPPEGIDSRLLKPQDACQRLESTLLEVWPKPDQRSASGTGDLEGAFNRLKTAFLEKSSTFGTMEEIGWSDSSAAVRRTAVALTVNEFLANPSTHVQLRFPTMSIPFKQEVKTGPAPNLNCGNQRGCPSNFDYPPYNPRGCGGPPWEKIPCEIQKEGERMAYETAKALAQTDWSAKKLDCERLKAMERLGCEVNQTWLNGVSSMPLGEVQGVLVVDEGRADLALNSLHFEPQLDGASAHLSVSARGKVGADVKWVAYNVGNVICTPQWSGRVVAAVGADIPAFELRATLQPVSAPNGELTLLIHLKGNDFPVKVTPPPFVALVSQNTNLMLVCPAVGIAGVAASVSPRVREELLQDTFSLPLPEQDLPIRILPIRFDAFGSVIRLDPRLSTSAIVFVAHR